MFILRIIGEEAVKYSFVWCHITEMDWSNENNNGETKYQ